MTAQNIGEMLAEGIAALSAMLMKQVILSSSYSSSAHIRLTSVCWLCGLLETSLYTVV